MNRTITVVFTDAPKVVFEADINTVGELRTELANRNIDCYGKALHEGITRADYGQATDDTVLPHDLTWKGEVTNNLVFMVTKLGKKTESGMTRAEAYSFIKNNNLGESIKSRYGKNYTNLPTDTLEEVIINNTPKTPKTPNASKPKDKKETNEECNNLCPAIQLILSFIQIGVEQGILPAIGVRSALHNAGAIKQCDKNGNFVEKEKPSAEKVSKKVQYSDNDIEDMFSDIE